MTHIPGDNAKLEMTHVAMKEEVEKEIVYNKVFPQKNANSLHLDTFSAEW